MDSLKGKVILIVDDDEDFRHLVRKVIESEGAILHEAEDVQVALEIACQEVPHLILTDLSMPKQTGFDFLEKCKQEPKLKACPILVLSSHNDSASVLKAITLGAVDYILKPFKSNLLLLKIQKALCIKIFLHYEIPTEQRPTIPVTIPIDMLMGNESGLIIDAPVRMAALTSLQLESSVFQTINLSEIQMKTTAHAGRANGRNRYISEINLIGISKSVAQQIRKILKKE